MYPAGPSSERAGRRFGLSRPSRARPSRRSRSRPSRRCRSRPCRSSSDSRAAAAALAAAVAATVVVARPVVVVAGAWVCVCAGGRRHGRRARRGLRRLPRACARGAPDRRPVARRRAGARARRCAAVVSLRLRGRERVAGADSGCGERPIESSDTAFAARPTATASARPATASTTVRGVAASEHDSMLAPAG